MNGGGGEVEVKGEGNMGGERLGRVSEGVRVDWRH